MIVKCRRCHIQYNTAGFNHCPVCGWRDIRLAVGDVMVALILFGCALAGLRVLVAVYAALRLVR
jgi:hypothetical protein